MKLNSVQLAYGESRVWNNFGKWTHPYYHKSSGQSALELGILPLANTWNKVRSKINLSSGFENPCIDLMCYMLLELSSLIYSREDHFNKQPSEFIVSSLYLAILFTSLPAAVLLCVIYSMYRHQRPL